MATPEGFAKFLRQLAQHVLTLKIAFGLRNLIFQHFWVGEHLEERNDIGKGLMERPHIGV